MALGLAALLPIAFLAVFFLLPVGGMLARGFFPDGQLDLSGVPEVLARRRTVRVLLFTLVSASAGTVLTLLAGLPVAFVLYRLRFPGRAVLRAVVVMPFVLPTVVVGVMFRSLLSAGGPLGWLGWDGTWVPILMAFVFFNLAVVVRTVGGMWEGLDRRAEESAAALGAGPWQVWRTVTLPALAPAVISAATLVFLFCSTAFGVVLTLGGLRYGTIETEIYLLTVNFLDLQGAAVLSVLQLLAVVVMLVIAARTRDLREQSLQRVGARAAARLVRRHDIPVLVVTGLVVAFVLLPVGSLVVRSLQVGGATAHLVLGRLLRPLQALRDATAQIHPEDLSRRVDVDTAENTDVAELAVRFNEMLDRIEDGVRQQRQFLDDAAHELRTPLTILRGNTELLRPDDPEDVATTRTLLLDELDRMQRLVDDLLVLARAQRPDFIRRSPTELAELAVECMDRITNLGERQWRLTADAEGVVLVDRQRLIQALVQLAANAVKFSEPGSIVELSTALVPESDPRVSDAVGAGAAVAPEYILLAVTDQGRGIPDSQLTRIFDRFGRAENTVNVEGSGLGLAIVQAIVQAHGGSVVVESTEGIGSRFSLWLPTDPPEEPENSDLA